MAAYRLQIPAAVENILLDAMWWKFHGALTPDQPVPTDAEKRTHVQLRIKEFIIQTIREYQWNVTFPLATVAARQTIDDGLTQANAVTTIGDGT